jgi:hypothetical protein
MRVAVETVGGMPQEMIGITVVLPASLYSLSFQTSKGGTFSKPNFDSVMKKLADESLFDFDAPSGTFTSKATGVKYQKHPEGTYSQGEEDAISHLLRGHTDNDFAFANKKSYFTDADKIFELIDDAMKSPVANRHQAGSNPHSFWVDIGKPVGIDLKGKVTTRIQVGFHPGTNNVIATAFPHNMP